MIEKEMPAYSVKIYLCGDIDDIKRKCTHWCFEIGCCVTVTETEYIYTGGREYGAIIGLTDYPRFPSSREEIWNKAEHLANDLIVHLAQDSALIQDDVVTKWISRRYN